MKVIRAAFISKVKPSAMRAEELSGIPAEYSMTQAAHESRYGLSDLAALHNNYHGIKDAVLATVPRTTVDLPTREYINGAWISVMATWAKYETIDDGFEDWARYIVRRFPKAAKVARDGNFRDFAEELSASGYATDPDYAVFLVQTHLDLWSVT